MTSPALNRTRLHHAQTLAVLDNSRALPQGDGRARPAFAGGAEGGERDLMVLDASDVLHDAFAIRGPRIDAEVKCVFVFMGKSDSNSPWPAVTISDVLGARLLPHRKIHPIALKLLARQSEICRKRKDNQFNLRRGKLWQATP